MTTVVRGKALPFPVSTAAVANCRKAATDFSKAVVNSNKTVISTEGRDLPAFRRFLPSVEMTATGLSQASLVQAVRLQRFAYAGLRFCHLDQSERSPKPRVIYYEHPALRPSGQPSAVQIAPCDLVSRSVEMTAVGMDKASPFPASTAVVANCRKTVISTEKCHLDRRERSPNLHEISQSFEMTAAGMDKASAFPA